MLLSFLNPDGQVARFGYAALMLTGLATLRVAAGAYLGLFDISQLTLYTLLLCCDGIHLAVAYHFYSVFFTDLHGMHHNDLALPLMYAWGVIISASRPVTTGLVNLPFFNGHLGVLSIVDSWDGPFYFFAPIGICARILLNYPRVTRPEARQRARWIVLGSLAGIIPYVALRGVRLISTNAEIWLSADALRTLRQISILPTALIPVTTTYAILRHQTFDVYVAVRRGLQYMMLKRVLQALLVLPGIILIISLTTQSQSTVADALWRNRMSLGLILFFGSVLVLRSRLTRWLNKRFYREAYDGNKILLALSDCVKKRVPLDQLAQTVATQVEAALHPRRFMALIADERGTLLRSVYDSRAGELEVSLPVGSLFLKALLGREDGEYITSICQNLSNRWDADRLIALGIEYIVPLIATADEVVGLFLLGPKLSEERYTPEDRKLLGAVANQMVAAKERQESHLLRQCPRCNRIFDSEAKKCSFDGENLNETLQIARLIENRYRLDFFIGEGGMGAVYQAFDMLLKRPVAAKILKEKLTKMRGRNALDANALNGRQ